MLQEQQQQVMACYQVGGAGAVCSVSDDMGPKPVASIFRKHKKKKS